MFYTLWHQNEGNWGGFEVIVMFLGGVEFFMKFLHDRQKQQNFSKSTISTKFGNLAIFRKKVKNYGFLCKNGPPLKLSKTTIFSPIP